MLMPADRKQLLAPARSAAVSALSGWEAEGAEWTSHLPPPPPHPMPSLPKASVAPLGFCCMMGYIQLLRSAGLEECCGCTPSHRLVSGARRDIKAPSSRGREGGRRGLRGSCLIGQSRGALSLSHGWWLIYHSTGEVRPHRPPLRAHHTHTYTHTFHWQIALTAHHLCSFLTTLYINELSPQSRHLFSQDSAEAPVLILAPTNSAAAFHGLIRMTVSVCVSPTCSFIYLFIYFLSHFCHLHPFPALSRDTTLTLPPHFCSHTLHILSILVVLWWKIHAIHFVVVICSSSCAARHHHI